MYPFAVASHYGRGCGSRPTDRSRAWLVDNGLDNVLAEKITNDVMDGEYVTIGSFCDDLIPEETNVPERLAVVSRAAEVRAQVGCGRAGRPGSFMMS